MARSPIRRTRRTCDKRYARDQLSNHVLVAVCLYRNEHHQQTNNQYRFAESLPTIAAAYARFRIGKLGGRAKLRGFLSEIRRRNVHRVALGYLAVGWLITEIMSAVLPAFDAPDWVGRAILLVFLFGLPVALWFSWEFELTTDGVKRSYEVNAVDSIAPITGRKLDFIIIGILAVAVVLLVVDRVDFDTETDAVPRSNFGKSIESIAVLPFKDFSADGDQQHLAEGLADTLLHMLAQIRDLRVAARTSSFSFRNKEADILTIGRQLGVGAILEGSVQRSGEELRIIAQLVRVSDQMHLWSRTFDRPAGDIFAIQDEIAREVVAVLRPEYQRDTDELMSVRTSILAYEHFLRGSHLWRQQSKERY